MTYFSKKISINHELKNTIKVVKEAMILSKFIEITYDENDKKFNAETPSHLVTFYEKINIKLISNNSKTEIHFVSKSHENVLLDWNKNYLNTVTFEKNLETLL